MSIITTQLITRLRTWALVAGLPMPRRYAMPGEQPNAFATGRSPRHAAVAPTHIANPLGRGNVATLFSTHPPIRERIRRLRAHGDPSLSKRRAASARLSGA